MTHIHIHRQVSEVTITLQPIHVHADRPCMTRCGRQAYLCIGVDRFNQFCLRYKPFFTVHWLCTRPIGLPIAPIEINHAPFRANCWVCEPAVVARPCCVCCVYFAGTLFSLRRQVSFHHYTSYNQHKDVQRRTCFAKRLNT